MSRYLFIVLCLLCISLSSHSQPYGQEWIDFDKDYYRVALAEDGIYRITFADLQNAGFPVSTVDPRRLQLYYKGEEQAIFVNGQGDAVFNTNDFIEFYGEKNDGRGDSRLYEPESAQPHSFYSIYSDSSSYFLTYNLAPVNGKRMNAYSENNTSGLVPESSHNEESLNLNTNNYSSGQGYSSKDYTKYTYFDFGEGWTSSAIQENQSADFVINNIINGVTADSNPMLEVLLTGRNNLFHRVSVSVGPNSASLRNLGSVDFDNYESELFSSEILWSDISPTGSFTVRVSAAAAQGTNALLSTSYLRLFYPQLLDMNGLTDKTFNLNVNAGNKTYIEINGTPTQIQIYDITDTNNIIRIGSNTIAGGVSAIINGTQVERKLLVNGSGFNTPILSRANFRAITPENHNYIIISNTFLMQSFGGYANPVKSYAGYRSSDAGGGYDTLVVDIDMLYNQFNYGIKNPLAIFDFMRFMVDLGSPEFLFIVGKGLGPNTPFHRDPDGVIQTTQSGIAYEVRDLVPAAGVPGSDIYFTAGLNGTTFEPAVPVGRLPARKSEHVVNYLNKVIETETLPYNDLWRKNVLHLSGGISSFELINFRSFMDGLKFVAEDDFFGGNVETIAKTSGSTVELINVADELNKGLNLITFFGHSAPNITDIDIGFVTNPLLGYNNQGKYPMFLINGCNAGEFFNAQIVFGEDWVLAADKGAVGFIAHSSFGFTNNLKRYSDYFYDVAYGDSVFVNQPIGVIQQEVAREYMSVSSATANNITQVQQMVLLGDPALKLFGADKPDYSIVDNDIIIESFDDNPVSALSDSFAIKSIVRNFGRTTPDSLKVSIVRTLADNSQITYDSIFAQVDYLDTIVFSIKRGVENGFGNNTFSVQLDSDFAIDELDETNNIASIDYFIPLFGTKNLYPLNYSIVSNQPVELLAQSTNLLEGERQFLFEIDTVDTFNSPFLKSNAINSKLLAFWNVDLLNDVPANDSIVYFWRTRFAITQAGESEEWVESSFIYIKDGAEGWSQSNFSQFDNSVLSGLEANITQDTFDYLRTDRNVAVTTYGSDNPATNADVSVRIDGIEYIIDNQKRCRDNTLNMIAFDKNDAVPYAAVPLIFQDARSCGRQPQVINSFTFAELATGLEDVEAFIDNVQDGDSVLIFTIGNVQPQSWPAIVLNKLEEIGASATELTSLENGEPYILFGSKGAPVNSANEYKTTFTPATEQQLLADINFTGVTSNGSIQSTVIGPSTEWFSLLGVVSEDGSDLFQFDVLGITMEGQEVILFENINQLPLDISTVNAVQYPFLKLRFINSDNGNLTPPQLSRWQVTYTPAAEGVIIAESPAIDNITLAEGAPLSKSFGFLNISDKQFSDSLFVTQTIFNRDSRSASIQEFKILAPEPGDTTQFTNEILTRGKVGSNNYQLNINNRILPEQYYENNLLDLRDNITVNKDEIDPVLDVLFDGRYILDGDIVSPTPIISIALKDENPFIKVIDTTAVEIFIKQECESCNFRRVAFSSPAITWFAASDEEDFKVEYRPERFEDGIYQLRIEAMDESGNESGNEPFLISFEVINETTITNFYPYPNPFSTRTRFVFTLTGNEIPNELIIRIMTVSGKVVREITSAEFGSIHIGNNISDFAWNGRDEFGDQLANGVYLYQVLIKQNGQTLKSRGTSADKAFKNGFGKLYILR